jgi:hypothetical protein
MLNGKEYFMGVLGGTNASIGASGLLHDGGEEEGTVDVSIWLH